MLRLKHFLSLLLISMLSISGQAQIANPVSWEFKKKHLSDNQYELIFTAEVDEDWYLYSNDIKPGGPIPTDIFLEDEDGIKLGGLKESGELIRDYEPVFDLDVGFYYHTATFSRIITLEKAIEEVSGFVEYMACDGTQCTPPMEFAFAFKPEKFVESKSTTDSKESAKEKSDSEEPSGWSIGSVSEDKSGLVDPVNWTFEIEKDGEHAVKVIFKAEIDDNWYIYAPDVAEGGPIPVSIEAFGQAFLPVKGIEASETPQSSFDDEFFEMEIKYFEGKVSFSKSFKLLENTDIIEGEVTYMACDDKQCTPPLEAPFSLSLPAGLSPSDEAVAEAREAASATQRQTGSGEADADSDTMATLFMFGIIGGLLALLTPCVFPMIMLTVSFFTNRKGGRNKGIFDAAFFGTSIILIYVLFGFFLTLILGPNTIQAIASNPWVNLTFFLVFVIFALSFFGAYDIKMPNSWANKFDSQSDRGGMIGVFFMALTLVVVSFSCTGPILGTLLIEAAVSGGHMGPLIGITGFSIAFAVPYVIFAVFPSLLEKLPKSGGWMNTIKVVLGFVILALSLKFLSSASRVAHWDIIGREMFIVIWILLFTIMGFYLLGKIRFKHDSPVDHVTIPRLFLAIICFGFSLYLLPGLLGAPLTKVSGWLPPQTSQEFNLVRLLSEGGGSSSDDNNYAEIMANRKFSDRLQCHHNIPCFFDYHEALAYAKEVEKPLLLDFTGHSCVNCDIMHARVWSDNAVKSRLANDFVLVQLYVDDRTSLPDEPEYRYLGQKWRDFQVDRFVTNTLPYYVILDPNENKLNEPRGYNTNLNAYIQWLDEGLESFERSAEQQSHK